MNSFRQIQTGIAAYRQNALSNSYQLTSAQTRTIPASHVQEATNVNVNSSNDGSSQPVAHASTSDLDDCAICLQKQKPENFFKLMMCKHQFCKVCLQTHARICVSESRVDIPCPLCKTPFHPDDVKSLLENIPGEYLKYERFMVRRVLMNDPDTRWCPAPNCGFAVIAPNCAACPLLQCQVEECKTQFCYNCRQHWHPDKTCDQARAERMQNYAQVEEAKPCPRCNVMIIKQEGTCNHVECNMCGTHFCWMCLRTIDRSGMHFLSTTNSCAMFGDRPTSQKKKITIWILALIGGPIGIPLVSAIMLPLILFGLPVWVAIELKDQLAYSGMDRMNRHLVVACGVTVTMFISPLVAVLSVPICILWFFIQLYVVLPTAMWTRRHTDLSREASREATETSFDQPAPRETANQILVPVIDITTPAESIVIDVEYAEEDDGRESSIDACSHVAEASCSSSIASGEIPAMPKWHELVDMHPRRLEEELQTPRIKNGECGMVKDCNISSGRAESMQQEEPLQVNHPYCE